jgi:hypothetical protein
LLSASPCRPAQPLVAIPGGLGEQGGKWVLVSLIASSRSEVALNLDA